MKGLPESALDLARLLREREISATELLRHHLDVISTKNPSLGAFVEISERRALRAAKRADALLAKRSSDAPVFLGVPTAIKDSDHLRFHFSRVGSRAFRWVISPVDGLVARTCRRAGFVFLGKLATSELTILPFVHTSFAPPACNPWDPTRYGGGSSGGSAIAVASDMLPIAPGSDGAGSIRIPASFCGLVGMKPSRGTLVSPYARFDRVGISAQGPIARTVADAAALLDVLAGRASMSTDAGSFAAAAAAPPKKLRIRLLRRTPLVDLDPEIEAATLRAAKLLEQLGHQVDEGGALDGGIDDFLPLMTRMAATVPIPFGERHLQPTTRWMRELGKRVTHAASMDRFASLERRVADWLGDVDAWIAPTVPVPPPKVGSFDHLDGEGVFRTVAHVGSFTAPFNISGQPAISVPNGLSSLGLPIGVQLIGKKGEDRLVLSLARQLEEAIGAARHAKARSDQPAAPSEAAVAS